MYHTTVKYALMENKHPLNIATLLDYNNHIAFKHLYTEKNKLVVLTTE